MKHRAKKLTFLAVGIAAVGMGCSPAFISRGFPDVRNEERSDAKVDQVALATTESQRLLDKVAEFLGEDPIDGRFGLGRVPTMHGQVAYGDKGVPKDTANLWGKIIDQDSAVIYSVGRPKSEGANTRLRTYRYSMPPITKMGDRKPEEWRELQMKSMKALQTRAGELMTSPDRRLSVKFNYLGMKGVMDYLAVYPTSKKCLSCHADVPRDEPIGVVALLRVPK